MLGNIGSVELLLIMLAVLLVFGAKRIPEIAQGLGKGIREFRTAMREISSELQIEDQQIRRSTNLRSAPARPAPQAQAAADSPADAPATGEPRNEPASA